MAPVSHRSSIWVEKFKITACILKGSNYIFISIHKYSHLETLLVLHILKRLDNYIICFPLFASLIFSFLWHSHFSFLSPSVSFPPLSCSLCFSFHVLPIPFLFFTFFLILPTFPYLQTSPLKTVIASFSLFPLSWRAGAFFTPLCRYKIYKRNIRQMRNTYRALRKNNLFVCLNMKDLTLVYPQPTNDPRGLTALGSRPLSTDWSTTRFTENWAKTIA